MTDGRYANSTPEELATMKARAMSLGLKACPACAHGWIRYLIATDAEQCPLCDYAVGPQANGST